MSSAFETASAITSALSRGGKLTLPKSSISVRLFDHYHQKVYGAGSAIRGEVVISPLRDTRFENIEITFIGVTRTTLVATQVPQRSSHTFLKLNMPILESKYPHPRVLEKGVPFTLPFHFVVPAQLTLSACRHNAEDPRVRDYHTRLPPTMGPGSAFWDKYDLAPETAIVEYFVRARVLGEPDESSGNRPARLFEATKAVRVLPNSPEDAPLDITAEDVKYTVSKTKSVRKGVFKGKAGRFSAAAEQPPAIMLGADGRHAGDSAITVRLGFEPKEFGEAPPRVKSVSAKLIARTYYGVTPARTLPDMGRLPDFPVEPPRLSYKVAVPLFTTDVDHVTWHEAAAARRDSGYSTEHGSSIDEDRAKPAAEPTHTAALYIPFDIPAEHKTFLPTFHSCLVSRVYSMQLTLTVGPANTTVSLEVPVQVAVEPTDDALALGMEAAEAAELEEYLTPRLLQLRVGENLPGYA
ncbi:uncharacterized protein DNG_02419 [Cephalotrichum gorgonifer]|uniref:Bul1 C-terminal domain-containing protein n=1 Tax=Cephalotrichum gorgonifer TaxID=2041049 RepID=A0AAE8MSD4_9PEZI|nr:uncharacterized protein DNG_02419 [Cephalotrichum gorgonifer]